MLTKNIFEKSKETEFNNSPMAVITNTEIYHLKKESFRDIRFIRYDDTIFVEVQALRMNSTKNPSSVGGGLVGIVNADIILVESDEIRGSGKTSRVQFIEINDAMAFVENLIAHTTDDKLLERRTELYNWLKQTIAPVKPPVNSELDERLKHMHNVMRGLEHENVNKIFDYAYTISTKHNVPYTQAFETAFEMVSQ